LLFDCLDEQPGEVVVHTGALRLLDGSSIGMLLFVARRAQATGSRLRVTGAGPTVLTALEIADAAKALSVYDEISLPAGRPVPVDLDELRGRHGGWPIESVEMLSRLAELPAEDPMRAVLRREVIELCLPAAERIARRFANLGESTADLDQVAAIGLIKAVDGFDPSFGVDFGGYAAPTIAGELKRHFRDRGWGLRVPRRLQELRRIVIRGREEFSQCHRRSPTTAELAAYLGFGEETVIEAMAAANAYRPSSLDAPLGAEGSFAVSDTIGSDEPAYQMVDYREALQVLMRQLSERERRIISLRFYGNLSQTEIATEVGISQMHVSRLLKRSLEQLRRGLIEDD
jgi:RNA polymerase sigma-70 factor (sigma-B/F/G subfamily)